MRDKPRFGVPHGRRRIAIHRAEISLAVDQRIAHRERLRHSDQRIVNRRIAVRMKLAEHLADDLGALARGPVVVQPHFMQAIQNTPMDGLQAISDVGQRSADDHAHGVIEIRALHLVFDIDRESDLVIYRREQACPPPLPFGGGCGGVLGPS